VAAADFSIDKLQRLDEGEWAKLRADYHDRIFGYVKRQVNHPDWADDLVQEVFLGAIRGIQGFDRRYNVEQYLMGIARNKVIDFLRRKRPEVNIADRDEDSSRFFNNAPGESRRPSQIQSAKETVLRQKDALVGAIKDLVAELRTKKEFTKLMAIELTFLTDWKHRRIAERLGIDDEKSIAGIKFRAIRDLQQRLKNSDPRRTLFSELWRNV
jgi:RNA polymerase sigma-70 factor (ECF subfamily)